MIHDPEFSRLAMDAETIYRRVFEMKLYEICFSPTGGTKKNADVICGKLSDDIIEIDLSDSNTDFTSISLENERMAVIAVPSYGGRMPVTAAERLSQIRGNGINAVLVCVYGNRAYEDTLAEMEDTAEQAGFNVVAAVAAIAEHSIVHQIASGRPDSEDKKNLEDFAEKIKNNVISGKICKPVIPGNRPYKKRSGVGMIPKPGKDCVKCGLCAKKCPVRAIDLSNPSKVASDRCISCMRCVTICPHSARSVNKLMLAAASAMLRKACAERKECELFI